MTASIYTTHNTRSGLVKNSRQQISYSQFRSLLRRHPVQHIVNSPRGETLIYTCKRQLLAIVTPPTFDKRGHPVPVNYYQLAAPANNRLGRLLDTTLLPLAFLAATLATVARSVTGLVRTHLESIHAKRPISVTPQCAAANHRWTRVRLVG